MDVELDLLAADLNLAAPQTKELSLAFGFACAKRIEQHLEEPEAVECLTVLER
jgi:hypothetical protein